MRKAAVCNGDRTTTGGMVVAVAATMSDHGRKIALDGERATCGTCEGAFRMVSSCTNMSEKGRAIVLDGDAVLCPCQRNRVIAGRNAGVFADGGAKAIDKAMLAEPAIDASGLQDIAQQMPKAPAARESSAPPTTLPEHPPTRTRIDPGECDYLDGTRQRIDAPARFYDDRHKAGLSGGKPAMATIPELGEMPATVYEVSVENRSIPIFMPVDPIPKGASVFDTRQILHAIGTLPDQHLQNLHKITVSPHANPRDAQWRIEYGDPDFYSVAVANIEIGVVAFPWKGWTGIPQRYVDSTLTHETAHQISQSLWRQSDRKAEWARAVASDARTPSLYAKNNLSEDFAESANMYRSSKGTPCEAAGRNLYPARYRYFDSIMK